MTLIHVLLSIVSSILSLMSSNLFDMLYVLLLLFILTIPFGAALLIKERIQNGWHFLILSFITGLISFGTIISLNIILLHIPVIIISVLFIAASMAMWCRLLIYKTSKIPRLQFIKVIK